MRYPYSQPRYPGSRPHFVRKGVLHHLGEVGVSHQLRQLPDVPRVGLQEPRAERPPEVVGLYLGLLQAALAHPGFDWILRGWRPFAWRLSTSMEIGVDLQPDVGPVEATVPGSVQQNLLRAGILPDWHVGLNSRQCEWVEHRHWDFSTILPAGSLPEGERLFLCAEGLDYSGWILLNHTEVARFSGSEVPHAIELTEHVTNGRDIMLSIVFDVPPEEQGQIGYTSESRYFKPRYNYGWDWCPRLVPVGISGELAIETASRLAVNLRSIRTRLEGDNATGSAELTFDFDSDLLPGAEYPTVEVCLFDESDASNRRTQELRPGETTLRVNRLPVEPWWPNGRGPQKRYNLEVAATGKSGRRLWSKTLEVGFKRVEWRACEGAPEDAEPWVCVVNGEPVFLQGVNWTPVSLTYQDVAEDDYERLIQHYKEIGCNLLRVWGGAFLETETFYRRCDEAGLMVWQEFPLSSSGIENWPPEDPEAIEELRKIARSYIQRRSGHVSLLLWCGGNELQGGLDGERAGAGIPVPASHPCLSALAGVVAAEDPDRRFVPSSPTGPRFTALREDFGRGLHHEVHGPWGYGETDFEDLDDWKDYWQKDDALFRSEVGMPGAADLATIEKYSGGEEAWPPTTELWRHASAWWTQWNRLRHLYGGLEPKTALQQYVKHTQEEQAEAYAFAARACKQRFPQSGGFLVWMGHDCFPCPSNNSIIDFDGNLKPAALALKQVFLS